MLRPSAYPGRWLVAASFTLAIVSAAVVTWWLAFATDTGRCEFRWGSSFYGTAERSWLPPGTTCTWYVNDMEHVDSPDLSRFAVLSMALFGIPLGLYARRLVRTRPDAAAR